MALYRNFLHRIWATAASEKLICIKDEELELPVARVCGEIVESSVEIDNGELFLTNYRIVVTQNKKHGIACIPIVGVESVEARDVCGLQITCKYGRIYRLFWAMILFSLVFDFMGALKKYVASIVELCWFHTLSCNLWGTFHYLLA